MFKQGKSYFKYASDLLTASVLESTSKQGYPSIPQGSSRTRRTSICTRASSIPLHGAAFLPVLVGQ